MPPREVDGRGWGKGSEEDQTVILSVPEIRELPGGAEVSKDRNFLPVRDARK